VVVWRQENLANYLVKGKQVYVEGRLRTHSYDDKDGKKVYATEVVADDVLLLGRADGESAGMASGGGAARGGRAAGGGGSMPATEDDAGPMGISDDDVPF